MSHVGYIGIECVSGVVAATAFIDALSIKIEVWVAREKLSFRGDSHQIDQEIRVAISIQICESQDRSCIVWKSASKHVSLDLFEIAFHEFAHIKRKCLVINA